MVLKTGGMRRIYLRGHPNIAKRLLIHIAGFNLGILLRSILGKGTPRGFGDLPERLRKALLALLGLHATTSSETTFGSWASFWEGVLQSLFWVLTFGTQIGGFEVNSRLARQLGFAP